MAREQAILSQLDTSARRGVRPERAQAALAGVADLEQSLAELEAQLAEATRDAG